MCFEQQSKVFATLDKFVLIFLLFEERTNWDFYDALRRTSLCFFFSIFYEFVNKNKKRYNFETAEGRNLKFTS